VQSQRWPLRECVRNAVEAGIVCTSKRTRCERRWIDRLGHRKGPISEPRVESVARSAWLCSAAQGFGGMDACVCVRLWMIIVHVRDIHLC
jgi:hypothetical protein